MLKLNEAVCEKQQRQGLKRKDAGPHLCARLAIARRAPYISVMTEAAPRPYAKTLAFRPVRPATDASLLISFGRGLYRESLGSDGQFHAEYGRYGQKFPLWIAACAARDPSFAAFLTEDEKPIGLVVLGADAYDARIGHVHHFYVAPSHRGQGFGGLLDDYARETLSRAGYAHARLNVTKRNARAIRFYLAQGWRDITPQTSRGALRLMEIAL